MHRLTQCFKREQIVGIADTLSRCTLNRSSRARKGLTRQTGIHERGPNKRGQRERAHGTLCFRVNHALNESVVRSTESLSSEQSCRTSFKDMQSRALRMYWSTTTKRASTVPEAGLIRGAPAVDKGIHSRSFFSEHTDPEVLSRPSVPGRWCKNLWVGGFREQEEA